MKTSILVLTLGIVGVIANPVSKQTMQSENKNSVQTESNDSQTKHEDVINTSNKGDQEQKKDKPIENPEPPNISDTNKETNADDNVEIVKETLLKPFLDEKCDQDTTKTTAPNLLEVNSDGDKGSGGTIELIIEENLVSDEVPQPQKDFTVAPSSQEFIENVQQLPTTFEIPPSPQFPVLTEDSQDLPPFIQGLPIGEEFLTGQQYPGYDEIPQLPGFLGGVPELPGLIEGDTQLSFSDDAQQTDEENIIIDEDYFKEDMEKIKHEIMETAAGFVPTPLVFRRKQKPRRRFSTRRHFRRNPYRRHQFFYPYYYAYYRPSSLRY